MLKILFRLVGCTIICLAIVSCSSMKSEHFVGEKIPIQEELEEESIWQFEDKVFYVRTLGSGESATITASSMQWNKSKKKYEIETSQVVMTELDMGGADDAYFLNLKDTKNGLYTILHLIGASNNRDMIFFTVDSETMKKHIQDGKVKAVDTKDGFILKLTKKELDNYIKENLSNVFNFGSAGVIKPIKGYKPLNH